MERGKCPGSWNVHSEYWEEKEMPRTVRERPWEQVALGSHQQPSQHGAVQEGRQWGQRGLLSRDMKQERQVLLETLVGTHQLDRAGRSRERMYSP